MPNSKRGLRWGIRALINSAVRCKRFLKQNKMSLENHIQRLQNALDGVKREKIHAGGNDLSSMCFTQYIDFAIT